MCVCVCACVQRRNTRNKTNLASPTCVLARIENEKASTYCRLYMNKTLYKCVKNTPDVRLFLTIR